MHVSAAPNQRVPGQRRGGEVESAGAFPFGVLRDDRVRVGCVASVDDLEGLTAIFLDVLRAYFA